MTAADKREELEALAHRNGIPAPVVAKILDAADEYAGAKAVESVIRVSEETAARLTRAAAEANRRAS